jgi:hypothetical protein
MPAFSDRSPVGPILVRQYIGTMMTDGFRIEVLDQGWLIPSDPDGDLCSHGRLRLTVGGVVVVGGDESFGISESALALLRTLEAGHAPQAPVADRMIFHGCGTILMTGCPIGADFTVRHHAGIVSIGNVVRYDTTKDDEGVRFPGLDVQIGAAAYRSEVLGFALKARDLFRGAVKRFADDFDAAQYRAFWSEFDQMLAAQGAPPIHPLESMSGLRGGLT